MQDIVTIFVYTFWIGVFCAVVYTAIDTPLRPVQNWIASWRDSFVYAYRFYWVALFIAAVFLTFPWLKFLVVRHWSALGTALLIVTAAWRPVAGGIRALIALRIHDWAALDVIDRDHARYQPNRRREIWSAAIGAGVVVVTLALTAVSVKLVPLLPGPWAPLGRLVNDLLMELAFAVLSLIRPCLSLGARRPIHAALVAFSRRPVGFFVWITIINIPAKVAEFAADVLAPVGGRAALYFLAQFALVLFKVFNFIAYEMTTLRMVQDLSLAPEEDFRVGVDESL